MVITSEIVCRTGTVRGQAKKNNVSIPRKTGKSTIVTHGTIRVKVPFHKLRDNLPKFLWSASLADSVSPLQED